MTLFEKKSQRWNIISKWKRKWQKFIHEWELKTAKDKWQILYDIPKRIAGSIGIHVFSDSRVNWYTYFGHVFLGYFWSLQAYTVYYYHQRGQFIFGLRCFVGIGLVVSGVPLYFLSIGANRFRLNKLLNFAGTYIYEKSLGPMKFQNVCEKSVRKMYKSYAILSVIISFSMGAVGVGPMIIFFQTGVWNSPLGTQFPYADESTIAFCLDLAIQMFILLVGALSAISFELTSVIINNAISTTAEIIKMNCTELTIQLENDEKFKPQSQWLFRNIIIEVQDYDRFIQELTDLYHWRLFLGPPALAASTGLGIFMQLYWNYTAGYGTAASSYTQLLLLCYMGYKVKFANEQIYVSLNRMPWHLLPLRRQKELINLLHRLQNGTVLTIGPFGELDYEMATDLTKRIYSFLTMLLNFSK